MSRSLAVTLALAALGVAVLSFVVLGFGRLLVGYEVAVLLAAPFGLAAFALSVVLFGGFSLALLGVGPFADEGE